MVHSVDTQLDIMVKSTKTETVPSSGRGGTATTGVCMLVLQAGRHCTGLSQRTSASRPKTGFRQLDPQTVHPLTSR